MPPDHASIRATLALVDYRDLLRDPSRRTAGLRQASQKEHQNERLDHHTDHPVCAGHQRKGRGWSYLSKEHHEAASLPLNAVDFRNLQDGMYREVYAGGMYQWRA